MSWAEARARAATRAAPTRATDRSMVVQRGAREGEASGQAIVAGLWVSQQDRMRLDRPLKVHQGCLAYRSPFRLSPGGGDTG